MTKATAEIITGLKSIDQPNASEPQLRCLLGREQMVLRNMPEGPEKRVPIFFVHGYGSDWEKAVVKAKVSYFRHQAGPENRETILSSGGRQLISSL